MKERIYSSRLWSTNNEIADYLNISIKTVEAQITKAFVILKNKLGEKYAHVMLLVFDQPHLRPITVVK